MGKTVKPLKILLSPAVYHAAQERFDRMAAQGHSITIQDNQEYDVILLENAWRMTPALIDNLDAAIKEARKQVYGDSHRNSHTRERPSLPGDPEDLGVLPLEVGEAGA